MRSVNYIKETIPLMYDVFAPQFELIVQLRFNCSIFLVASSWIDITET